MPNKRVSAIIIEKRKILLIHRTKPGKDYFVLPGGSVKESEDEISALVREIKEETNLEIEVNGLLWRIDDSFDKRTQFIYSTSKHSGKLELGSPERERHSKENKYILEWHDINDLKAINFFPIEIKTNILETFWDCANPILPA